MNEPRTERGSNFGYPYANTGHSQLNRLWENAEVKNLIISAHGLLPILEILEPCTVKSRQHMILHLLKIVNLVRPGPLSIARRTDALESLC